MQSNFSFPPQFHIVWSKIHRMSNHLSLYLRRTFVSSHRHFIFISTSYRLHFKLQFHIISPRPYCLTLQPSFRSFRFVTILQPTIFNGSCSYLAQLLASVKKCTVLTMHGSLCTFSGTLWLFEMVRIHYGRNLSPDSLPLYSQYHRMDPLHIWYSCWAGAWSWFIMGFLCWFFFYIIRWYLEIVAITGTIKVD